MYVYLRQGGQRDQPADEVWYEEKITPDSYSLLPVVRWRQGPHYQGDGPFGDWLIVLYTSLPGGL